MSVAHQLNYSRTIQGNAVRQIPEADRSPQAAPRPQATPRRLPWAAICAVGGLWVCVLAVSLAIVHINGRVAAETAAITSLREEVTLMQQKNLELEGRLAQASSVSAIEKWAAAKGMTRPAAMSRLKSTPSALAVLPAPVSPPAPVVEEPSGIWGALKSYIAQVTGALNLVGSPR